MLRTVPPLLVLLLLSGAALAADPAAAPAPGEVVQAPENVTVERPIYGPILSDDPLVRAEIKRLYIELRETEETTFARVAELNTQLAAETDPDFRYEIVAEISAAKTDLERRNIELSLEIAHLNGDLVRVADLQRALEQMENTEVHQAERVQPSAEIDAALRERNSQ